MKKNNLVAWQWSDYSEKHKNHVNLLIHIIAVPLFWLGTAALLTGIWQNTNSLILTSPLLLVFSFILQGLGHRLEIETPAPFGGPLDFIRRFLTEQFVNFPRFVLSGIWYRSL